jgi:hypothetical protein
MFDVLDYAKTDNFSPWEFLSGGEYREPSGSSNSGTSSCYLTAQHGDDSVASTKYSVASSAASAVKVEVYFVGG